MNNGELCSNEHSKYFFFLRSFDPPCGSHLGFAHTFLVIFSGVSRRNILINFIEIAHTARTYYSKVRNRATFVI